jgi:hypothetical protein
MTTTTRPALLPLTVADAHQVHQLLEGAAADLERTIAEVRSLLMQRDLVEQVDTESATFCPSFMPVVASYHALHRSLRALTGEDQGPEYDLSTVVEAQSHG